VLVRARDHINLLGLSDGEPQCICRRGGYREDERRGTRVCPDSADKACLREARAV
jgi:hypothetical protein